MFAYTGLVINRSLITTECSMISLIKILGIMIIIRFDDRSNKIVDIRGKPQTAHGLQSSELKFRVH